MDAGSHPRGFEVMGGLWVDDSNVYTNCIKTLGLDGGVLPLANGLSGVWDHYQDYYSGTAQMPAPVVPVLIPQNCHDLGM
jgi:hypothetical protein